MERVSEADETVWVLPRGASAPQRTVHAAFVLAPALAGVIALAVAALVA